ncbi:NAD-dependent epimerase/dehydratase family protein [Nocardioides humi]|uniref:SDR family oxidoreductase n=1 Tax=Nocardioides humi TaxID=449461 RepID=A0ABN2BSN6_9ACTN|nr:NAD-dependent epimerase/dehydratase family protein [Nocardioides humi]
MPKALVVGGTGPTGPQIVAGLVERGFETTVFHRGTHEAPFPDEVAHLHADPHFAESIESALSGRSYDVAVCMYGRLRLLAPALVGRTERVISVGGPSYLRTDSRPAGEAHERLTEPTMFRRMLETEETVFAHHERGDFSLTHLRFATMYGPRQLAPREWSIIRRLLDGRTWIPVLDGGLTLESRSYVDNAAHAVLSVVDHPEASAGRAYNVADADVLSDADTVAVLAGHLGVEVELVTFPARSGQPGHFWGVGRELFNDLPDRAPSMRHQLLDTSRIRRELGYVEPVPTHEGLRRTAEWYARHRPRPGGEEERQLGDPFDYAAEDAYRHAAAEYADRLAGIPFAGNTYGHPYDHPRASRP